MKTGPHSQEGIALVITLILLAVTLVMAIAFLAISRRESASVTTYADMATAKYAADAALAKAEAHIIAQIETTTNPYVFGLMVSTNYINPAGFTNSGPGVANLENVNYDHLANSSSHLSGADMAQNIANLYYDPRPPVFYPSNDFRFYLDLNRNGRYDTNGFVTNVDNAGNGLGTVTPNAIGDPEWIGILEHPDQPHGPNNPFIARYCFIAVPANSLDFNYIHNQALEARSGTTINDPSGTGGDAYWRNQGVGTWEINLAAFLADLNTNRWDPPTPWNNLNEPYSFPEQTVGNSIAFDDARSLVAWRYTNSYSTIPSVNGLFGARGYNAFEDYGVDDYGVGSQTTFDTNFSQPFYFTYNWPNSPWAGAPGNNSYFSFPSDLFDTNEADIGSPTVGDSSFVNNVYSAGTNRSPYDSYTFYRMLAQLGTDTSPAQGKIHLNYKNAFVSYDFNPADGNAASNVAVNITIVPNYETNFVSWNPQDFFTAAANQLLKAYTTEWYESSPSNYMQTYYGLVTNFNVGLITNFSVIAGIGLTNYPYVGMTNEIPSFGITNIPVYVNGSFVYTPAVNRLLQLAANIYDSTTNLMNGSESNYPSVFRPVFWKTTEYNPTLNETFTNIYIRGFHYLEEGQPSSGGVNEVVRPVETSSGVQTLTGTIFSLPCEVTDPNIPYGYSITNVWGVPWIVGAKKAFPNFNGFELDNIFFIERKLQFNRNSVAFGTGSTFPYGRVYWTNQMYIIGISNSFAMDDWNSYATAYNNAVTVFGQNMLSVGLTNDANFSVANLFSTNIALSFQPWPSGLYVQPFGTNITVMQSLNTNIPPSSNNLYVYYFTPTPQTLSGYTFTGPCFVPTSLDPSNYMDLGTPPLPQFGLVATNHLQAFMMDTDPSGNYHLLDYVQLGDMDGGLNVNQAISDPDSLGFWSTNFYGSGTTPVGVINQYLESLHGGTVPTEDQDGGGQGGQWVTTPVPGAGTDTTPAAQQAFFSAFFSSGNNASYEGGYVTNWDYNMQAPFTPMREIVQRYVYQANDPLVHYLTSDLNDFVDDTSNKVNITAVQTNVIATIGHLSDRYMPWGNTTLNYSSSGNQMGNFYGTPVDNNPYNLSFKDPLVWTSDNWDFPTNKYPTVGWLGRVHRGTPWQSVYLKSPDIWGVTQSVSNGPTLNTGHATWQAWTGNLNADDAFNEDPLQDRLLFDLFTAAPNDDATRGQVSVNIGADDPYNPLAGLASWSALLSGTLVFSNDAPSLMLSRSGYAESPSPVYSESWPGYSIWTNQPLGSFYPNGIATNLPLGAIVQGINSTRTNFVGVDGLKGVFEHVGDILAVPQLSVASPYLSYDSLGNQVKYGVSDEMYEWLPQQMLGLMTVSGTSQNPPRYVIYCYGQTLKPAPNGYVTTPIQFFGLYTNYQVVAESAARVVLRVVNTPSPANPTAAPHVIVEQYNTLPPD